MALLGIDAVRIILRRDVKRAGGQAAWARLFGVKAAYVSHTLSGARLPTKEVLQALRLMKVPAYQKLTRWRLTS